jgi:hypothetical protein
MRRASLAVRIMSSEKTLPWLISAYCFVHMVCVSSMASKEIGPVPSPWLSKGLSKTRCGSDHRSLETRIPKLESARRPASGNGNHVSEMPTTRASGLLSMVVSALAEITRSLGFVAGQQKQIGTIRSAKPSWDRRALRGALENMQPPEPPPSAGVRRR